MAKTRTRKATPRNAHGFFARNGLSLVLAVLFLGAFVGQVLAGRAVLNEERVGEGRPPVGLVDYLREGQFVSATFENWESEFLQMGLYVLLTVWLRQRGSAESRPFPPEPADEVEEGPTPRAAKARGFVRWMYANSLSLAFLALAAISFGLHWEGSWRQHVDELRGKGQVPPGLVAYLGDAQLWFESFQNWQSEFLAVLALVVLSIFLRQDGSPQSKPLEAPHSQTGA